MRTTIDLPDELLRQAKAHAALTGTTLKDLVTACLSQGLRNGVQLTSEPRRRSELPIARRAAGPTPPVLSNRELYQILDDEETARATQR